MKRPLITCLLIAMAGTVCAQTQTKRPSWSQGLPERESVRQPEKPGFKPETTRPSIQTQPDLKAERPVSPDIEIELSTQPNLNLKVAPKALVQPETNPVRRAGFRHMQNKPVVNEDINPLHDQYNWTLLKTIPIDIPARHTTKSELKIRIYINPEGEVVRVAAGAPDVPAMMLKQAQKSIQQWQFEPPKNIGITDNIAKTFTIEIKTG